MKTEQALSHIVITSIDSQQTIKPTIHQLNNQLEIAGDMFRHERGVFEAKEMALRDLIRHYKIV